MKITENVRGTQFGKPKELEVNIDTVYIRSKITKIEEEDFIGWQYDEIQYDVKDYIQFIGNKNTELNKSIALLEDLNVSNMIAMTEMYEENLDLKNKNTQTMIALTEMYELLLGGM